MDQVCMQRTTQIRNVVKRVFGCWHLKLSLPFTRGDETYQTCISCGARRRYDLDQWTAAGGFYYPEKLGGVNSPSWRE